MCGVPSCATPQRDSPASRLRRRDISTRTHPAPGSGDADGPRGDRHDLPADRGRDRLAADADTVHVSSDGRPISTPCTTSYAPPSGSAPVATSQAPSASAADPVAGSSATPASKANTRQRAAAPSHATTDSPPNGPSARPSARTAGTSSATRASASARTGRTVKPSPQEALRTSPARSSGESPAAASSGAASSTGPYDGVPPVSVTVSPATSSGSSPAPHDCTTRPSPIRPRRRSTSAAPTDGWPANGSSVSGVKIRSR